MSLTFLRVTFLAKLTIFSDILRDCVVTKKYATFFVKRIINTDMIREKCSEQKST